MEKKANGLATGVAILLFGILGLLNYVEWTVWPLTDMIILSIGSFVVTQNLILKNYISAIISTGIVGLIFSYKYLDLELDYTLLSFICLILIGGGVVIRNLLNKDEK